MVDKIVPNSEAHEKLLQDQELEKKTKATTSEEARSSLHAEFLEEQKSPNGEAKSSAADRLFSFISSAKTYLKDGAPTRGLGDTVGQWTASFTRSSSESKTTPSRAQSSKFEVSEIQAAQEARGLEKDEGPRPEKSEPIASTTSFERTKHIDMNGNGSGEATGASIQIGKPPASWGQSDSSGDPARRSSYTSEKKDKSCDINDSAKISTAGLPETLVAGWKAPSKSAADSVSPEPAPRDRLTDLQEDRATRATLELQAQRAESAQKAGLSPLTDGSSQKQQAGDASKSLIDSTSAGARPAAEKLDEGLAGGRAAGGSGGESPSERSAGKGGLNTLSEASHAKSSAAEGLEGPGKTQASTAGGAQLESSAKIVNGRDRLALTDDISTGSRRTLEREGVSGTSSIRSGERASDLLSDRRSIEPRTEPKSSSEERTDSYRASASDKPLKQHDRDETTAQGARAPAEARPDLTQSRTRGDADEQRRIPDPAPSQKQLTDSTPSRADTSIISNSSLARTTTEPTESQAKSLADLAKRVEERLAQGVINLSELKLPSGAKDMQAESGERLRDFRASDAARLASTIELKLSGRNFELAQKPTELAIPAKASEIGLNSTLIAKEIALKASEQTIAPNKVGEMQNSVRIIETLLGGKSDFIAAKFDPRIEFRNTDQKTADLKIGEALQAIDQALGQRAGKVVPVPSLQDETAIAKHIAEQTSLTDRSTSTRSSSNSHSERAPELVDLEKLLARSKKSATENRYLTGIEIALAAAIAAVAVARTRDEHNLAMSQAELAAKQLRELLGEEELSVPEIEGSEANTIQGSWLTKDSQLAKPRRIYLIAHNDTLPAIAERFYEQEEIAWLIADINTSRITEHSENGKRIIELRSRQEIELPHADEVNDFLKNNLQKRSLNELITIVIENELDRELVDSFLSTVIGATEKSNAPDLSPLNATYRAQLQEAAVMSNNRFSLEANGSASQLTSQGSALFNIDPGIYQLPIKTVGQRLAPSIKSIKKAGRDLKSFIAARDWLHPGQ